MKIDKLMSKNLVTATRLAMIEEATSPMRALGEITETTVLEAA